jgi:hypothetical protein
MHPRLRNLLLATTPLLAFGLTQATATDEEALHALLEVLLARDAVLGVLDTSHGRGLLVTASLRVGVVAVVL